MMPLSNRLLDVGGVALLWTFKVMIVASATTARLALAAVQAVTIGLACVSISNLAVLNSIQG